MPAINAHLGAELMVEDETWPVFVWTIDHPAGRVLVDTGMIDTRREVDDMSPTPHPENIPRDVAVVRPYYRMASNPVHPNVRGSLFDLGVGGGREILLAGPSTAGLADPGHAACISLMQTTVCLLNHKVEGEGVAVML